MDGGGRGRGRGRSSSANSPPAVVGDSDSGNNWWSSDGHGRKQNSDYRKKQQSDTDTDTDTDSSNIFDICPPKLCASVVLKPSLLVKNKERRNEMKRGEKEKGLVLREGMVLLKGYIPLKDQVKIVKLCRDLGVGVGGFYQPGYGGDNATKLHLKMMCLGKNWDPETNRYGLQRSFDGAKPPHIPPDFHHLIQEAIRDSHALIQQHSSNPQLILPPISPDICIVNFYSQNGRLGLHQDKDESQQSLAQGLPVVSFSIGDSADFLYGDERDVDKAKNVVLESGDVLIFGGKSRHIFHGVTAVRPKTASIHLLEETNLRPGRLNLTFRQY